MNTRAANIGVLIVGLTTLSVAATLSVDVTTSNYPRQTGTTYYSATKHIVAMWIQDASGRFVNTFGRWAADANRMQYLGTWEGATGGARAVDPDGVTAATRSAHGLASATWTLNGSNGQPVGNGTYFVCIEMTNQHLQGPVVKCRINIDGTSETRTAVTPDSTVNSGGTYLSGITLTYNASVGVAERPYRAAHTGTRLSAVQAYSIDGRLTGRSACAPGVRVAAQRGGVTAPIIAIR